MTKALALVFALALAGCGFTPGGGDLIRDVVNQRGAQAFDAGLANSEWFICFAASIGSVKRRYGADPTRAEAYKNLCGGATADVLSPAPAK